MRVVSVGFTRKHTYPDKVSSRQRHVVNGVINIPNTPFNGAFFPSDILLKNFINLTDHHIICYAFNATYTIVGSEMLH